MRHLLRALPFLMLIAFFGALACEEAPTEAPDIPITITVEGEDDPPTPLPPPDSPPPPTPPAPDPVCGDTVCEGDETASNCPADCLSCVRPVTNDAVVNVDPAAAVCLAATAAVTPCRARFSVSPPGGVLRILWDFGACIPSQSSDRSGEIRCLAPGNYPWSSQICSSTAGEDPTDFCCADASGSVTFAAGTP